MKSKKYLKGMVMLEVLTAMLLFAFVLIPLVRLQVASLSATRAGFYKTETAAAAESMMDYLRTDVGAIFNGEWKHVVVTSGPWEEECKPLINEPDKKQEKIACDILNPKNGNTHADNNAILCVLGKRPQYSAPTIKDPNKQEDRDQYLISIRAIWYSGKRNDDGNNYNNDLTASDCGSNYDTPMNSNIIEKENIDSIQINMAY